MQLLDKLIDRFGQSNGPLLYQLEKEISELYQGNDTVAVLYQGFGTSLMTFLKCLFVLVQLLAIKKTMKITKRQRLMHCLMHLNDNYEAIRGQILLLDPLPNVNRAYSMIQRVEIQRNATGNITANREVAANVDVMKSSLHTFETSDANANVLAIRGGQKGRMDFKKAKGKRFCDHCQRSGHMSDQCFKVIGYLDWYQGPKDNVGQKGVHIWPILSLLVIHLLITPLALKTTQQ